MPNPPDSEAVTLWRNKFHLNLSASWKHDVDITVTDIELWKSILADWHYLDAQGKKHRKAPGIKNLLTEYERQVANRERDNQAPAISARSRSGLSERRNGQVSKVSYDPPSCYFRTSRLA